MKRGFIFIVAVTITFFKSSRPFIIKTPRRLSVFNSCNVNKNNVQSKYSTLSTFFSTATSGEVNKVNESLRDLYPPPKCFNNGSIAVDNIHNIFYSEYGDLDKPLTALYLHGGPGAGSFPNHARFFDPKYFRVVLFDQRGCGRSTPKGETRNNTLQNLVQDCQTIMNHLKIAKWDVVVGGSFGVTLALAYASQFPTSVEALVLRGVCLMRPREIDWLFGDFGGGSRLNPNAWNAFSRLVENDKDSFNEDNMAIGRKVLAAYYDRLLGNDPRMRLLATKYWSAWEMQMSSITSVLNAHKKDTDISSNPSLLDWDGFQWISENANGIEVNVTGDEKVNSFRRFSSLQITEFAKILQKNDTAPKVNESQFFSKFNESQISSFIPAQAMLTCYYSYHNSFLNDESLLGKDRIDAIRNIPCIAIQGGLDFICPPDTMLDLHNVWPEMKVRFVLNGGHSVYDPLIKNEVVNACDHFKTQLLVSHARVKS